MIQRFLSEGARTRLKSQMIRRITRQPLLEERVVRRALAADLTTVLDIGANRGQYAQRLRSLGWTGAIHSFEPLNEIRSLVERIAARDPKHQVYPFGLGEASADMTINIASNRGASSSLLDFDSVMETDLKITCMGTETVRIERLDRALDDMDVDPGRCLLKIDTQGFERQVIEGAGARLIEFPMIFLEVSLRRNYKGEPLFDEMVAYLSEKGFQVADMEPSVFLPTGIPMQCDLLCIKADIV